MLPLMETLIYLIIGLQVNWNRQYHSRCFFVVSSTSNDVAAVFSHLTFIVLVTVVKSWIDYVHYLQELFELRVQFTLTFCGRKFRAENYHFLYTCCWAMPCYIVTVVIQVKYAQLMSSPAQTVEVPQIDLHGNCLSNYLVVTAGIHNYQPRQMLCADRHRGVLDEW